MDVISIYVCPLGAGLAGIMFLWVGGKDFALKAVNQGAKKPVGNFYFLLSKYICRSSTNSLDSRSNSWRNRLINYIKVNEIIILSS